MSKERKFVVLNLSLLRRGSRNGLWRPADLGLVSRLMWFMSLPRFWTPVWEAAAKVFWQPRDRQGSQGWGIFEPAPPSEAHSTVGNIHPRWADRTGDWSILGDGRTSAEFVFRFVWEGLSEEAAWRSVSKANTHMLLRERWRTFRQRSPTGTANRDKDLSTHGPHVWQLNRQHDWLHERGIFQPLHGE